MKKRVRANKENSAGSTPLAATAVQKVPPKKNGAHAAAPRARAPLPPSVNAAVTAHRVEDGKTLYECGGEWVEADKLNKQLLKRYSEKLIAAERAASAAPVTARACSLCGEDDHASDECEEEEARGKDKGEEDDEDYGGGKKEEVESSSDSSDSSIALESEEPEERRRASSKQGPKKKKRRADRGEPGERTLLSGKGQKDKRRDHAVVPRNSALQHMLGTARVETLVPGTLMRLLAEPKGDAEALKRLLAPGAAEEQEKGDDKAQAAEEEEEEEDEDAAKLVRQRKAKEKKTRKARKRFEQRREQQQQQRKVEEPQKKQPNAPHDDYEDEDEDDDIV